MRAVGRIVISLVVLAAVAVVPASPAMAASGLFVSDQDGRCLEADVAGGTDNGTDVQLWQCIDDSRGQQWVTYSDRTIRSSWDGRCLEEDTAGGTDNGSRVQLWDCTGQDNQEWDRDSDGTIRSVHDGRCLSEDAEGGTDNGTKAQVWDCDGDLNQSWHR
jgi:Ricin-type beta-trefoil lectin domain